MKNTKNYEGLKEILFIAENKAMEETEKAYEELVKHSEETGKWCGNESAIHDIAATKMNMLYEIIKEAGLEEEFMFYDYKAEEK